MVQQNFVQLIVRVEILVESALNILEQIVVVLTDGRSFQLVNLDRNRFLNPFTLGIHRELGSKHLLRLDQLGCQA